MKNKLDEFTNAYLVAALWTSTDDNDAPLDSIYDISNISKNDIKEIKSECLKFQKDNLDLLIQAYHKNGYTPASAGHDLWLTRNGHGAGFWDRDLNDVGDLLTKKADEIKGSDLYVGDDNTLYFTNLPSHKVKIKNIK
jgi:hypothetical protein